MWHGRPRLLAGYEQHRASLPAAVRVRDELRRSMAAKEATGCLDEIIAETRDEAFKWVYP